MLEPTDPAAELAYLGDVIQKLIAEGAPPPHEEPSRVALLALSHMGRFLELTADDVSDDERAFLTRDAAVYAAASVIVAATHDPVEIRLIRKDLLEHMQVLRRRSSGQLNQLDLRYEGTGASLFQIPHLASISDVLLADPTLEEDRSRPILLDDVCFLVEGFMALAYRLRAWATLQVA